MGRNYCVVKDCTSTDIEFSLFGFPKNCSPEWIQVVKRPGWSPTKSSKICEKHFSPHHIDQKKTRKILVRGAVPVHSVQTSTVINLGIFSGAVRGFQKGGGRDFKCCCVQENFE